MLELAGQIPVFQSESIKKSSRLVFHHSISPDIHDEILWHTFRLKCKYCKLSSYSSFVQFHEKSVRMFYCSVLNCQSGIFEWIRGKKNTRASLIRTSIISPVKFYGSGKHDFAPRITYFVNKSGTEEELFIVSSWHCAKCNLMLADYDRCYVVGLFRGFVNIQ